MYCERKAKPGVIINKLKVCEICYYWIKKKEKEKREEEKFALLRQLEYHYKTTIFIYLNIFKYIWKIK